MGNGAVESMYECMHVYMTMCVYVKLNNELSVSSIASCQTNGRTRTHIKSHNKTELIMTNFVTVADIIIVINY